MTQKHTQEPWIIGTANNEHLSIFDGKAQPDGKKHLVICHVSPLNNVTLEDEANAERIVACVNACAGLNDNQLKYLADNIREGNAARREREALKAQHKELLELLKLLRDNADAAVNNHSLKETELRFSATIQRDLAERGINNLKPITETHS